MPTIPCHEFTCNLCFLGVGKNWAGPFFPHPVKVKYQPYAQSYQVGKTVVHMINPLRKNTANLTLSWIHMSPLLFGGWGKTGPAHSFPTLTRLNINLKQKVIRWGKLHKVDALSCRGWERMGWPGFPPPPKKQWLFAYSWQGKVDTFTSRGEERMG